MESVSVLDPNETVHNARQREIAIHVPQAKLNSLVAVLDELVTTQSMLADILDTAVASDSRVAYLMGRLRRDAAQARDMSAEMGMVKIGSVFSQMRRLVRMMAQEYGRSIIFISEGDAVPVDGSMVETMPMRCCISCETRLTTALNRLIFAFSTAKMCKEPYRCLQKKRTACL